MRPIVVLVVVVVSVVALLILLSQVPKQHFCESDNWYQHFHLSPDTCPYMTSWKRNAMNPDQYILPLTA